MSSRLTIVSHAATAATRLAAFPKDEPIEPLAPETACEIAASVRSLGSPAKIWVAPERRALETAKAFGLAADIEPSLGDIDLGRWSGLTFKSVEQSEPESLLLWLSDPDAAPHGGESVRQLLARVSLWLDKIEGTGKRLAAIAHPAIVRAAIVQAIGAGPTAFWRIDAGPLSRAELSSNGRRWTLRSLINP